MTIEKQKEFITKFGDRFIVGIDPVTNKTTVPLDADSDEVIDWIEVYKDQCINDAKEELLNDIDIKVVASTFDKDFGTYDFDRIAENLIKYLNITKP